MKFDSIDDARAYVLRTTSVYLSPDDVQERLHHLEALAERVKFDEAAHGAALDQLETLKKWSESAAFKKGAYAQGLDELMLRLVDLRATVHAFQGLGVTRELFKQSVFHAQWLSGVAYEMYALLGKLVSKDDRDNSLRRVWEHVQSLLLETAECDAAEAACIGQKFAMVFGGPSSQSPALKVRNKVIAHNEMSLQAVWSDFDEDIRILGRVWALLVRWCSGGVLYPFRDGNQVFRDVSSQLQYPEIQALKASRDRYLDGFRAWCTLRLDTGLTDQRPGPFARIAFGFQ